MADETIVVCAVTALLTRKALAFELNRHDVVESKYIVRDGDVNPALSRTMCLLHAAVGHSLQAGSYDGAAGSAPE